MPKTARLKRAVFCVITISEIYEKQHQKNIADLLATLLEIQSVVIFSYFFGGDGGGHQRDFSFVSQEIF